MSSRCALGFGFTVYGNEPAEILALGQRADELGFDRVWLGEHVVAPVGFTTPHPYQAPGEAPKLTSETNLYDVWVLGSMLLGATERLEVATGVLQLPLRHPLLTARASISAWELSGGRFVLGVGLGWMVEEYEALGVPFVERGQRYDEILEILRKIWAGGKAEHTGPAYPFGPLQMTEEPVDIPLVFGGTTEPALRRAAGLGDGWFNPSSYSLEDCVRIRAQLDALRREYGRDDRSFTYHIRIQGELSAEQIARYHEAGFDELVIGWQSMWPRAEPPLPLAEKLARLEQGAEQLGLV